MPSASSDLAAQSRVVGPAVGERNFHIFYQVTANAEQSIRGTTQHEHAPPLLTPRARALIADTYYIYPSEQYLYLTQSQCFTVDGVDDAQEYRDMQAAIGTLDFSEAERNDVFRLLSVILWLGNLQFAEDAQERSSVSSPQGRACGR
jgi:myosin-1